jgi:hypothetical protein
VSIAICSDDSVQKWLNPTSKLGLDCELGRIKTDQISTRLATRRRVGMVPGCINAVISNTSRSSSGGRIGSPAMVMSNAEAMREKERRQRTAPSVRQSPSNQRGPELFNFNLSDAKLMNG